MAMKAVRIARVSTTMVRDLNVRIAPALIQMEKMPAVPSVLIIMESAAIVPVLTPMARTESVLSIRMATTALTVRATTMTITDNMLTAMATVPSVRAITLMKRMESVLNVPMETIRGTVHRVLALIRMEAAVPEAIMTVPSVLVLLIITRMPSTAKRNRLNIRSNM